MKKRLTVMFILLGIVWGFGLIGIASANNVGVEISHAYFANTYEDEANSGDTFIWWSSWLLNFMNDPDGGGGLNNPVISCDVTGYTDSDKINSVWPDNPEVYKSGSPNYLWNFGDVNLVVEEPAHLNVSLNEDNMLKVINFTANRSVSPELIDQVTIIQTITVNFTIDEPFPQPVDNDFYAYGFRVGLGGHYQAYGWERLLDRTVLDQKTFDENNVAVGGWITSTDGVSAHWSPDFSYQAPGEDYCGPVAGKTYTFVATVSVSKSSGLVGDPTYMPVVMIGGGHTENDGNWSTPPEEQATADSSSIIIYHPYGPIGTFTVQNPDIDWSPFAAYDRYEFNMDSRIESEGHLISGMVTDASGEPIGGVNMTGFPTDIYTDDNGLYGYEVPTGWSGSIAPLKDGYIFTPQNVDYVNVHSDFYQDYSEVSNLPDSDGDGVTDDIDQCLETVPGDIVDENGCSIADLCPCDNDWKNHGKYVSCVTKAAKDFVKAGLIDNNEKGDMVSEAAQSSCGK